MVDDPESVLSDAPSCYRGVRMPRERESGERPSGR